MSGNKAKLKFNPNNFEIVENGDYVVCAVSGKDIPYNIVQRRKGDPAKIYASTAYAKKILNWSAEHSSLENIIETTWRIYK